MFVPSQVHCSTSSSGGVISILPELFLCADMDRSVKRNTLLYILSKIMPCYSANMKPWRKMGKFSKLLKLQKYINTIIQKTLATIFVWDYFKIDIDFKLHTIPSYVVTFQLLDSAEIFFQFMSIARNFTTTAIRRRSSHCRSRFTYGRTERTRVPTNFLPRSALVLLTP